MKNIDDWVVYLFFIIHNSTWNVNKKNEYILKNSKAVRFHWTGNTPYNNLFEIRTWIVETSSCYYSEIFFFLSSENYSGHRADTIASRIQTKTNNILRNVLGSIEIIRKSLKVPIYPLL